MMSDVEEFFTPVETATHFYCSRVLKQEFIEYHECFMDDSQ